MSALLRGWTGGKGSEWTASEERDLLALFDQGAPVSELAKKHGRTKAAITTRLTKLGRLVYIEHLPRALRGYYRISPTPYATLNELKEQEDARRT